MQGAFDVGMQNKRLTLYGIKAAAVHVFHELDKPTRAEKVSKPDLFTKGAKHGNAETAEPAHRARFLAWIGALVVYIVLVLSDYVGSPRMHGSKLAVLLLVCTPGVMLILHVCTAPTQTMAVVAMAHLAVALDLMGDTERLRRDTVSMVTLWACAAVFMSHAVGARPVDMAWQCQVMCCALYMGTCVALALLQATAVLDSMTLLTLQQLFLVMTLLLASLVRYPAHC
jgi:hypothetical protein